MRVITDPAPPIPRHHVDHSTIQVSDGALAFYVDVLRRLDEAGVPFLVGGAFALDCYAGVARDTKDLDLFCMREDWDRAAAVMSDVGYQVLLPFPHWLGKIKHPDGHFVDVIYNSGNGLTAVDEVWFENARETRIFGHPVLLCPPEETVWSKSFVMERERFDGADVAHLLRAWAERMDWERLVDRFGPNWPVLLAHLTMFDFIYPGERSKIPAWVMRELTRRLDAEHQTPPTEDERCQGTLVSREQYLVDVQRWGYRDARLEAEGGTMSEDEVRVWTDAIARDRKAKEP